MKFFFRSLVFVFAMSFFLGGGIVNIYANVIDNLDIEATGCNVQIKKSNVDNVSFICNSNIFDVSNSVNNGTSKIILKVKNGKLPTLFDMITVKVPDKDYTNITVKSISSGITLPVSNSNLKLINENGSMSFYVSDTFNKNIYYKSTSGSGRLIFDKNATNYTLNLSKTNSSVSLDASFPAIGTQTSYTYSTGNALSKINLDVSSSSFSVDIAK